MFFLFPHVRCDALARWPSRLLSRWLSRWQFGQLWHVLVSFCCNRKLVPYSQVCAVFLNEATAWGSENWPRPPCRPWSLLVMGFHYVALGGALGSEMEVCRSWLALIMITGFQFVFNKPRSWADASLWFWYRSFSKRWDKSLSMGGLPLINLATCEGGIVITKRFTNAMDAWFWRLRDEIVDETSSMIARHEEFCVCCHEQLMCVVLNNCRFAGHEGFLS